MKGLASKVVISLCETQKYLFKVTFYLIYFNVNKLDKSRFMKKKITCPNEKILWQQLRAAEINPLTAIGP